MSLPIISCRNVSLKFEIHNFKSKTIKEALIANFKKKSGMQNKYFSALKNINFEIFKGDRVGIIGKNGSGKSTLLKTIAKIYVPTKGTIETNYQITPLLEAGAGFNPECTGRENIYLHGAINRISKKKILKKVDEIVKFAEVEKFIDVPVKYYSTGMYMRLAFSVATSLKPEILIIDELFVGGDYSFLEKGQERIFSLIDSSKAMLLVSHDHELLRTLCNRFIWIEDGYIKQNGSISVLDNYLNTDDK